MPGRRLTVVQLLPALNAGGVERSTLEIGRALAQGGHRSIVVSGVLLDGFGQHPQLTRPDDMETAHSYEKRYPGLAGRVDTALAAGTGADAEIARTATAIAELVDSAKGSRPRRVDVTRLPTDR